VEEIFQRWLPEKGKTLVASLPSYVRALEGKGVHVITGA